MEFKLTINPEIQLRILACALCGEWVTCNGESFRGYGEEAIAHIIEEHPQDYKESLDMDSADREEFWTGSFYLYTERHFACEPIAIDK